MAEILTPQQKEAVYNRGGKLLVSAAAGSGKTKVLVDRLLSYIMDTNDPANIDEFLIITYTKAAASELRGKIAAKLSERIAQEPENRHLQQQMQRLYLTKISTVHGFCADILREYAYLLDIPADFRVADENECHEIQVQVIEELLEGAYNTSVNDTDFLSFINTQGFGRNDHQIPDILLKVYNSAKCHLDPDEWLDWCVDIANTEGLSDASQTPWGSYLIDDLRTYLDLQIAALQRCIQAAAFVQEMEKPVALLESTIKQLSFLAEAKTWDDVVSRKDIDFGRLTFLKKCTDIELTERIKAVRGACKKGLERKLRSFASNSAQVLLDLSLSASASRGLISLVRRFSDMYDKRKKVRRILDFSDLEHKTLDLLLGKKRTGPTVLSDQISARFREIMVDEYQDSNGVQDAIFDVLTRRRKNCFMVGDVKQSIYQFRLADPSIFIDKYNSYVMADEARGDEGRKILLSSNFRSSAGVIHCVNDVFSYAMSEKVGGLYYSDAEKLHEGIPHLPLIEPEVELYGIDVNEDTYAEEADFVAQKVHELLDGSHMVRQGDKLRPICPEDIVILLRSPGSVGGEFAYALEQKGIRYTTGGSVDLLQTEEVIVLRSLLQIISNPLQDIPLVAVMMSRIFGFTADDLAMIRGRRRSCSIYESVKMYADDRCRAFIDTLCKLRQEARLCTLSQLLQRIFLYTSMDSIFAAMPNGLDRKRNLNSFCQVASDFELCGQKDLTQFLEYLDTMETKGLVCSESAQNAGSVTIMSIHKSKGLEFPVVFLCGLSRSFNLESTRDQVLCHKDLGLGLNCIDGRNRVRYPTIAKKSIAQMMKAESISEEMRVLYVAMTRARDKLVMTYAAQNLENDLSDIALRLDLSGQQLMTSQVDCPGSWVLQTAMQRTEAGEFFARGGKPDLASLKETPWSIRFVKTEPVPDTLNWRSEQTEKLSEDVIERLQASLNFVYPYMSATTAPSKLTATQMKGRFKDLEAAENTDDAKQLQRYFRRPGFAQKIADGKEKGNAVHSVMRYIHYEACCDLESIKQEINRLVEERKISPQHAKLVDPEQIAALFTSQLGIKLRSSEDVLREFKFSILDDCWVYDESLAGEQVLLQGVVDCAIVEPEGITVIDFKTDSIKEEKISEAVENYKIQVNVYANALERIYNRKVIGKYLYFFSLNQLIEVPTI